MWLASVHVSFSFLSGELDQISRWSVRGPPMGKMACWVPSSHLRYWKIFPPSVSVHFSGFCVYKYSVASEILFAIIPMPLWLSFPPFSNRLAQNHHRKVGLCARMYPWLLLFENLSRKFIGFKSKCPIGSLNSLRSMIETYWGCVPSVWRRSWDFTVL